MWKGLAAHVFSATAIAVKPSLFDDQSSSVHPSYDPPHPSPLPPRVFDCEACNTLSSEILVVSSLTWLIAQADAEGNVREMEEALLMQRNKFLAQLSARDREIQAGTQLLG